MKIERPLIHANQFCDYVSVLSIANNTVDMIAKAILHFKPTLTQESLYGKHIQNKSMNRMLIAVIPLVGSSVLVYHMYQLKALHNKSIAVLQKSGRGLLNRRNLGREPRVKILQKWGRGLLDRKKLGRPLVTRVSDQTKLSVAVSRYISTNRTHSSKNITLRIRSSCSGAFGEAQCDIQREYKNEDNLTKKCHLIVSSLGTSRPKTRTFKGLGEVLMRAIIKTSLDMECEGRVGLDACGQSHGFYYKMGFRALDPSTNFRIKNERINEPEDDFGSHNMYLILPAIAIWKKILAIPVSNQKEISKLKRQLFELSPYANAHDGYYC